MGGPGRGLKSNEKERHGQGVTSIERGLNAKRVLHELSLTYRRVSEGVNIVSPATVSNIVNRNIWPTRVPREKVEARIERFLKKNGATDAQLGRIWEFSETVPVEERQELPGGNGKAHSEARKKKHRLLGVRMIDLECMKHFRLERNPFPKKLRGTDDMFWSKTFERAFEAALKVIEDREFACIVGESGSGKTTLRLMIEERLRKNTKVRFVTVLDAERERMRPNALAMAICRDLNPGRTSFPNRRESLYDLARRSMAAHTQQGVNVILQIEEAHALHNEAMKSLKRIIELTNGFNEALTVLMYAQPEILEDKFSYGNITLREVALRCMMIPLPGIEKSIEDYLRWKIEKAGGTLDNVFTADAIRAIKQRLTPNDKAPMIDTPLQVHALASNAMMRALITSEPKVTGEVINSLDRWYFVG